MGFSHAAPQAEMGIMANHQILAKQLAAKNNHFSFDEDCASNIINAINVPSLSPVDLLAYVMLCCGIFFLL